MLYAETKWIKIQARIDTIDSIPELMKDIEYIRDRQKYNLDYETYMILTKSLERIAQHMRILTSEDHV
jgi:hypothetical protein